MFHLESIVSSIENKSANYFLCYHFAHLQIDLSKLEDEENFDLVANSRDDTDTKSKILTAKVQDAVLKVEAAISVRNTYREILNIMKKVRTPNDITAVIVDVIFRMAFTLTQF